MKKFTPSNMFERWGLVECAAVIEMQSLGIISRPLASYHWGNIYFLHKHICCRMSPFFSQIQYMKL